MTDREQIQAYIDRLEGEVAAEEAEPGLWVLTLDDDGGQVVITNEPPVLVFRVNVMRLPDDPNRRSQLMQKLLELNAGDMVHGSYGLEGTQVVLTEALQLENLAFSDFQASVESITLALGSHMATLASFQE